MNQVAHGFSLVLSSLAAFGLMACGDDGTTGASSETSTGSTGADATTTASATTTTADATTGAVTDASGTSSGPGSTTTPPPSCGDGNVDAGEECDDGNVLDTDACTGACKNAVCGDGVVQTGVEECDDGNADNTDSCLEGCKNAMCGDGFVGPGETCDDGNTDDTDACLGTCAPATCGDGFAQAGVEECDDGNMDDTDACTGACKSAFCGDSLVQAGVEACDDGNMVDTDTCVAGCKLAKCGDGLVLMGTEECDDGNMSDADTCTVACKTPTCTDKAKNGLESDVDCGGACATKCADGQACVVGGDCTSSYCGMNVCGVAPSCKAIKASNIAALDGLYDIDPDGNGPGAPFKVYCDMTVNGGGWTLVLKADGTKTTFLYDVALWTNASTYQPNFPDLDRNEAKLPSFMTVSFTEVLVGFEYPIAAMGPLTLKTQKLTAASTSLSALISTNTYTPTMIGRTTWKSLIPGASLQLNCNQEGFNSNPANSGRSRIGIVSNNENTCASPDSYVGIGNAAAPCGPQPPRAVGNVAGCAADNGDKNLPAFGVVFVR